MIVQRLIAIAASLSAFGAISVIQGALPCVEGGLA